MDGSRPRILFLAPRYPYPATRGDQRRVIHFLEGLAQRAEVTLACFGDGPPLPFEGVRVETVALSPAAALAANARNPDARLPLQARLYLSRRMDQLVRHELASRPDVLHVTLARMGPYLHDRPGVHTHVDFIDALSLNMDSRAAASRGPARPVFKAEARLMARYEAQIAARADSSSVVSEADRRAAPGLERAAVIPNGVDMDAFPFSDPSERPPRLIFFGNLGYFHNVEPARFVAEEVFPRVRAELPQAMLIVAGARPAAAVRRLASLAGVELHADVDSMASELHGAATAVLPMFTGSGMKNKVVEAFCAGTPVVTNGEGVAGVPGAEPGRHYLLGEGAEELASACVRLLRDGAERHRLAAEGARLVGERLAWEHRVDELVELYGVGPVAQ